MGCCLPSNRMKNNIIIPNISKQDISTNNIIKDDNKVSKFSNNNKKENESNTNTNKKENIQTQPITTNINNINININKITNKSDAKSSSTNKEYQNEDQTKIVKPVLDIKDKQLLKEIFSNHFLFKNKSNRLISSIISCLEMMIIPKDTILFKKGAKGYYFYVIKEGKIQITFNLI